MLIAVCGIACEICPRRVQGTCPVGEHGCTPRQNNMCKICDCAFQKEIRYCFECEEFPCKLTENGPINFGYCKYISGKAI
ncbi:MAG: hypothetical protein ACFFAO_20095 [Candidatus Hermodarchaeota archaeon]